MAKDRRDAHGEDADWIFAIADPGTLPTEQLPSREEFERHAAPLLPHAQQAGEEPSTSTSRIPAVDGEEQEPATRRWTMDSDPDAEQTLGPDGPDDRAAALPGEGGSTYARSGTTPTAEGLSPRPALPARFADLSAFDALRDVAALVCLVASLSTTFTVGPGLLLDRIGAITVGVAILALVVVHLLRWLPKKPPLRLIRVVRVIGLAPALIAAVGTMVTDLVFSVPVLFSPLPDGPPVGIGAGVSLLLVGVIVGIEPRAHEGFLPSTVARARARALIKGIGIAAAVAFALSVVMLVGRVLTTGWAYSLLTFASALVSVLLLLLVLGSAMRRERTWFVFSAAAVGGLVVVALADNSLRFAFAAPSSFATGFVYLPFLFAAWSVMISRSFVRTMPLTFRREDWLVYTVRAFEFSAVMHTASAGWHVLAGVASLGGAGTGGIVLHLVDAVVAACFVVLSLVARRALLDRPAEVARSTGVVVGVVMVVVGFLSIIVNSLASGAGAGLETGAVALAVGVGSALMLTVPAPVRDEFGAPDLVQMFEDFRRRDREERARGPWLPDVSAERARKKTFPG